MSDIDYLQWQVDDYRDREERRLEEERAARKERERERQELHEEELRTAADWPEALAKQSILLGREVSLDEPETGDPMDTWFADGRNACDRAGDLWEQVAASKQARIKELEQQLAAIQDEIREEVGQQLLAESDRPGWKTIAHAMLDNENLGSWLYW